VFKNLRTSTMLVVLCGMFIASVAATTYSLIAEKRIAIEFARKELDGSKYVAAVRNVYATILDRPTFQAAEARPDSSTDEVLKKLATAQSEADGKFQTEELARSLSDSLRVYLSRTGTGGLDFAAAADALADARQLILRVADDSNLTLDPDLDSYHLQEIVSRKLPEFLSRLGELQVISREPSSDPAAGAPRARFQILGGLVKSIADDVEHNLAAAYRGNPDGHLRRALEAPFSAVMHDTSLYLGGLDRLVLAKTGAANSVSEAQYTDLVGGVMGAWEAAQTRLDELLQKRIAGLSRRMYVNLALIGALAALSVVVAVLTYRHTVLPLRELEGVASEVRATKNYGLRIDYASNNEIGQLSAAFNDMLSELAAARERERAEQSELARVARLTSMGAMTVAIAHEINQPLAAVVANSSAAQRWLSNSPPNVDEARGVLKSIVSDGHRASQVIGSVRGMFQKEDRPRSQLAANDVIREILVLVNGEVRRQRVIIRPELSRSLPDVAGDRIQLQQVFMNLILNAVESMANVSERERLLRVKSHVNGSDAVEITVQDSGVGIKAEEAERIFDAFYTTKSEGMGMGLFICRSIVESHGGRLWATPCTPYGSTFHVELPGGTQ
jgi:signal transduction histidine kinase